MPRALTSPICDPALMPAWIRRRALSWASAFTAIFMSSSTVSGSMPLTGSARSRRARDMAMAPESGTRSHSAGPRHPAPAGHVGAPPALPLTVFGPAWAPWIVTTAAAASCPPDYVAAPLLASVSTLIGNARWAQATPGWVEPRHLWIAAVGDSGNGKSPGADCLMRDVLPEIERHMLADWAGLIHAGGRRQTILRAELSRREADALTMSHREISAGQIVRVCSCVRYHTSWTWRKAPQ